MYLDVTSIFTATFGKLFFNLPKQTYLVVNAPGRTWHVVTLVLLLLHWYIVQDTAELTPGVVTVTRACHGPGM